ncbi:transporter [Methylobacterium sp. J-059]|uniref:transporter n=1 Tax=Methylobacterium sp. J-059 TaxID=2836643 RepID=UPI001FB94CF3|nr:transporter [Methylobacterium sp. J-059]MCJ2038320.1 transporter [Methylobacterium sp. J-059]
MIARRPWTTRTALALLAALLPGGPAWAGSAAQPGQTVGLPVGAQLPVGFYFVNLSSFGVRDTRPLNSESNVNLPTFAWATPWTIADARLQFFLTQPVVASSGRGAPYQSGVGQPLLAAQLAWDLGNDLGFSYLFGGYLPIETRFLTQSASITQRFAVSYTGNGWNLTANLLHGIFIDDRSPTGTLYPDYLNLDLTATRKLGQWQVGAVAFGSTDLPTGVGSDRPQGQVAVGGLVGYNFGPVNLQAYLTRDVVERNYGGRETRGWLRAIVPLYQDKGEVEPNRTLVTRRQGE